MLPGLAQVELGVTSIRRLRIGGLALGESTNGAMPPGAWRYFRVEAKC